MNPDVDFFFDKKGKWQEAYSELRDIALKTGLTEELKWGCPTYTREGKNIFLIHGFKDYCAILFMQGALLNDPKGLLTQQTKTVQAARQMRFVSADDVLKKSKMILAFMKEAIKNDKAGLKTELKKTHDFEMVAEFKQALKEMPELKAAFKSITPGRQRAYLLYFSSAKLAKTRNERVEKCIPKILDGKGLDD